MATVGIPASFTLTLRLTTNHKPQNGIERQWSAFLVHHFITLFCALSSKNKEFQKNHKTLKTSDNHNDLITVIARVTRTTSKKETRNLLKKANYCIHVGNGGLFEHLAEDNTN